VSDHDTSGTRVVMLLENNAYEGDVRVRGEAESLAPAGYDVTVIAPRRGARRGRADVGAVHVERFRLPELRLGSAGFVVEYLIAAVQLHARGLRHLAGGAQILHLHNPPDIFFPLAAIARAMGRRVVFDHHDLTPEMFEAKFSTRRLRRVLVALERATFRCASVVLAANESHRLVATGRGGVAAGRVAIVRNGPPDWVLGSHVPPRPGALDDPVVIFVGEMASQDGVHELPVMLEALVRRHGLAGTRLVLVGRGPEQAELAAALRARDLEAHVSFVGQVPHAAVFAHIAAADVCVDPSPRTDYNDRSTMIKIAEYLAAGRPVVCHALTETRRTAGDAALYVEAAGGEALADAVAALARDPARRAAMCELGRGRAAGLTWGASERVLLAVYARLGAR
jgi:glycosyltransferase involved in cell wall biosynthesis